MHHILITDDGSMERVLRSDILFQPLTILTDPKKAFDMNLYKTDVIYLDIKSKERAQRFISAFDKNINLIVFQEKDKKLYPYKRDYRTIYLNRDITPSELSAYSMDLIMHDKRDEEDTSLMLVGSTDKIVDIKNKIAKFATKEYPVHLSGSTGTGKTLAAHRLHHLSGKKSKMVYVNSGSMGEGAIAESNLFGHKRGAYTDARETREGYLKRANGTTIFLDEIENLSLHTQEIMLDTIERGVYRTIGDDNEIKSSFRVITASNVPLDTLVRRGKLRKDFYYRIAERELTMPDLRERMDDIPELVSFFERTHSMTKNKITDFTPFFKREWEGNIRELFKEVRNYHEDLD